MQPNGVPSLGSKYFPPKLVFDPNEGKIRVFQKQKAENFERFKRRTYKLFRTSKL